MKHTKGPWKVDKVFGLIMGPKQEEVAAIHSGTVAGCQNLEVSNYNARLIGAAPELLEACQAVMQWLEDYNGHMGVPQMKQLRTAIDKAEGK